MWAVCIFALASIAVTTDAQDWADFPGEDEWFDFDFTKNDLQLKTKTPVGSGAFMSVAFLQLMPGDDPEDALGFYHSGSQPNLELSFQNPMTVRVNPCMEDAIPLNGCPAKEEIIWKLQKDDERIVLSCDGVEVFDYTYPDECQGAFEVYEEEGRKITLSTGYRVAMGAQYSAI